MELLANAAWQWNPKATLTAVDTSDRCTVFALQYSDSAVLQVHWNEILPAASPSTDPRTNLEGNLELHGHAKRIICVKIYHRDRATVWYITGRSCVKQFSVVENLPSEPRWIAFDDTSTILAVACARYVKVFVIERKELLVTLAGHLSCVGRAASGTWLQKKDRNGIVICLCSYQITSGKFHPIRHHLLITASEDRTFKIWDLAAKTLWFQSAVLSAFAILSIALDPINGDAAFGFADGSVKVFDLKDGHAKELFVCNVEGYIQKMLRVKQKADILARREKSQVISSLPLWARRKHDQNSTAGIDMSVNYGSSNCLDRSNFDDDGMVNATVSCPVLSMKYVCFTNSGERMEHNSDVELLSYKRFLVVGIPGYLLSINAYSFEIATIHDFQQPAQQSLQPIGVANDFCFFHLPHRDIILDCGVISAFQPCFTMLRTGIPSSDPHRGNRAHYNALSSNQPPPFPDLPLFDVKKRVSIIPSGPPPENSVLNTPPLSAKKTPPKKANDLDKPVTFHTRIKSSGYGSFINSRRIPPRPFSDPRARGSKSIDSYFKEYPKKCKLLQHYQPKHALLPTALHQGAILHIEFSSDAKWLATSGNDRVAQVCKLPLSRFKGGGNVFVGHTEAVRAIHWSQNDQTLVTIGGDKTSRVWLTESETCLLTLKGIVPLSDVAVAASAMGSLSSVKKATTQDIVEARFFYMDKFLLSACGNAALLHQFELDEAYARASNSKAKFFKKKNDIEIVKNKSRKKRVAQWSFDDMQSVTSLACVNGAFLSSIAIIAGSDRSLRVLDVGAGGRAVRVVRDAHSRAVHTVALPRPTCYASHPSNFYDLLLSSSSDSTVHLWDIRADNCVMRFCQHVNRVHTLGVTFSPCMRYVATGSEDRAAYIYDIRTGRQLAQLKGHTDVVTTVAFSPLYPQLATASYDGTIRFYSSEKVDLK